MLHPCMINLFIMLGPFWHKFLNLFGIDLLHRFQTILGPKMVPKRPFGQPCSTNKCQQHDFSPSCGVRESVFEATLRRTTLKTYFYKLFSIVGPVGTTFCKICTIVLDLKTMLVVVASIPRTTNQTAPQTQGPADQRV